MSIINTNMQAILSAQQLDQSQNLLDRSLMRLSSGSRISEPADDPAGLAVSEKLTAQNQRITSAQTNVQNAISLLQTSDGFMNGIGQILSRMSELAVMATDGTKNASDISLYGQEFQSLQDQLRQTIGGTTAQIGGTGDITTPLGSFNGINLFGPNPGGTTISIGQDAGQTMNLPETNLQAGAMLPVIRQDASGNYGLSVTSPGAVSDLNGAIQYLAGQRASLGAAESRLNLASATLQVQGQNMSAAISSISDVDVAQESTQLAKYNVLVQSGAAMLAQANATPQSVLKLLQNS